MTYDVVLREGDAAADNAFKAELKEWMQESLSATVEVCPSLVINKFTKIGTNLVREEYRVRTFKFSRKSDALLFKLRFK